MPKSFKLKKGMPVQTPAGMPFSNGIHSKSHAVSLATSPQFVSHLFLACPHSHGVTQDFDTKFFENCYLVVATS